MSNEPRIAKIRKMAEEQAERVARRSDAPEDAGAAPQPPEPEPPAAPPPEAAAVAEDAPQRPARNRQEGPTPRDLRRARRKARRLGLDAADDHEALRLLQEKGIELWGGNESILEFVPPKDGAPEGGEPVHDADTAPLHLPAETMGTAVTAPAVAPPPAINVAGEAERLEEIAKIQRQLIRRRRRRLAFLFLKLGFFVLLPTFLVGWYYYNIATEMFETQSEFVIEKAESSSASPLGGLFAGTGFAASQDSITVQGFLTSREAMLRLDADHGFISHFQQDWIDDVQRLPLDATSEDAYELYQKRILVGFDPTEGIIRMEVVAATPEASQTFSTALITYAEERVDNLSQRLRDDQMAGAIAAYEQADLEVKAAQERVLKLQQQRGVLSAEVEISAQMSLVNALELEREQKRLDLAEIEANSRPNDTRLTVMRNELERIDTRIIELREALTQSEGERSSLAMITSELAIAEADLVNRQLMLQSALQQSITAEVEAARQVRYLSIGVTPVAPDVATYPRKLENTILAFIIFGGAYILLSLTVSILREQVSV